MKLFRWIAGAWPFMTKRRHKEASAAAAELATLANQNVRREMRRECERLIERSEKSCRDLLEVLQVAVRRKQERDSDVVIFSVPIDSYTLKKVIDRSHFSELVAQHISQQIRNTRIINTRR